MSKITEMQMKIAELLQANEAAMTLVEQLTTERDALAAQVIKLEKRIKAINEGIEEYKSMSNDATADLVHKALMSVREEIIQRDLYQTAPDFIEQFANQYADSIRKGGAV